MSLPPNTATNTLIQPGNANNNTRIITLPNFNSVDPQRFFTQALFILETNKIVDPADQYPYLIEALPLKILDIVAHSPKQAADPQTKLEDLIRLTCDRCNVDEEDKLSRFMKCTKKQDVTFLDFLGTLRRLAHAAGMEENISKTLVQHRFMDEIKEGTLKTIAQTNLNLKESLDRIAKLLDQHAPADQEQVNQIRKQTTDTDYTLNSPQIYKQTQDTPARDQILVMLLEQMKKIELRLDTVEAREKSQQNLERRNREREINREHSRDRKQTQISHNNRQIDRPPQQHSNHREAVNARPRNVHFSTSSRQDPASCYYHNRFGARAYNCEGNCKWQKN